MRPAERNQDYLEGGVYIPYFSSSYIMKQLLLRCKQPQDQRKTQVLIKNLEGTVMGDV